jgi:hypothetical protein
MLPGIFDMPASWRDPPRVYRLPINWKEQIFLGDNRLKIISIEAGYAYSLPANASAPSSKVIFLDTEGGRLTRLTILINAKSGERMLLKPESIPPHPLPTSPLYTDVIKWRSPRPVQYLVE